MNRRVAAWWLFGLASYIGLYYTVPLPWLTLPGFLGLTLGASLPVLPAGATAVAAWLTGSLLAPLQSTWFEAFFFEPSYLRMLNAMHPFHPGPIIFGALVAFISACTVAQLGSWNEQRRRALGLLLLALLTVNFLLMAQSLNANLIETFRREPPDKSYYFDGIQQLKALHLYYQGHDYYTAFRLSMEKDSRTYAPGYPWNSLRPPLLYWLLGLLPNPGWVPLETWGLTALAMVAVYWTVRSRGDCLAALVAPALLGAYYLYPETNAWLMTSGLQGSLCTVLSLCAFFLWGARAGIPLLWVTLFIREWAFIPIALFAVRCLLKRQWRPVLAIAVLGALTLALFQWHTRCCREIVGMTGSMPVSSRLQGSTLFALATLRFGTVFLAGRELVMPAFLGLCGAALWRLRGDQVVWLLVPMVFILYALFHVIGNPGFAQYYGFCYVPLVLWGASLTIASLAATK